MNRPDYPIRTQIRHRAKAALPLLGLLLAAACARAGVNTTPGAQPSAHRVAFHEDRGQPYALVHAGEGGITMTSGGDDDRLDVKQLRKHIQGDFLWFRDDGRSYVIQDPAVLARARAAWAPVDRMGEQMNAYGREMDKHGKVMDTMGRDIDRATAGIQPDAAKMRELEHQMDALGVKIGEAGQRMAGANDGERARLDREMARMSAQMGDLGRQMGDMARADIRRQTEVAMKDISLRMKDESKPMNALGRKMHALGKDMERESHAADATVHDLIRDAQARGLARPAPQD